MKSLEIENHILKDIQSGKLRPGQKLVPTAALAKELSSELWEVQQALASLSARGILRRKPRVGTYVNEQPKTPAIVILVGSNTNLEPSYMLRSLIDELCAQLTEHGYKPHVISDLYTILVNDEEAFQNGVADLKRQLHEIDPAGIIEIQFDLDRLSDIYPEFNRPSVKFNIPQLGGDIYIDPDDFITKSLEYLAGLGCRKALLMRSATLVTPANRQNRTFWDGIKRHNFLRGSIREVFIRLQTNQPINIETEAARRTEALLKEWSQARRNYVPDCLIVTDDIIMRGVATALIKSDIRVPEDITIITLANKGIDHHYGIPVTRFEIDQSVVARKLTDLIDLRVRKVPVSKFPNIVCGTITDGAPHPQPHAAIESGFH